jgi:DNA (cytosine-5)-methyltransferase 1
MIPASTLNRNKRFTALSLFSGGGGATIGTKLAGGDVRGAIEFSNWAARTYRRNHPDCRLVQQTLRDFSQDEDAAIGLIHSVGLDIGKVGYVQASPPCQPHSRGGRGMGDPSRSSLHSGIRQTYSATLPWDVAKFVHTVLPETGVLENVTGIVTSHPSFFVRILNAFRFNRGERAYYCYWKILSAEQFGVPQKRPRVFLIFIRKDVAESVGIWSDRSVLQLFPMPTHSISVNIQRAFKDLVQTREDEAPFFNSIRKSRLPYLLRQLPRCPSKPQRLQNVDSYFTLVRCSWNHPAPTLVIAGQKPNGLSGAIHPELDRKFTVPELKRLFSLPDDYFFIGTIAQAVDTICNMVPPPVERAIADSIYRRVLKPYYERHGRSAATRPSS